MTRKELSQLYYIDKEIRALQKRLAELRAGGFVQSPVLSETPRGGPGDKVADLATEIACLEQQINAEMTKRIAEERRLRAYIASVDDALLRLILQYRHIDLLRWWQVADRIGGGNTADSVRMLYKRFLSQI